MAILRSHVTYAKALLADRLGNEYVYGGWWTPDINQGADCSGLVTSVLSALGGGPEAMVWGRRGLSTESYRYKDFGGPQNIGPFILYHVRSPNDFPADVVAKISLHHEGAGGPDSHMNICVDGIYMESSGSYGCCTQGNPGPPQWGGAIPMNNSYWNDWWYLAGPIVEDGAPSGGSEGDYVSSEACANLVGQFL